MMTVFPKASLLRLTVSAGVTALIVAVAPAIAHAQEAQAPAPPPPAPVVIYTAPQAANPAPLPPPVLRPAAPPQPVPLTKRNWYGWQTLATDGASLALFFAAVGSQSEGLGWASLGGYALGGPVVHFAHERIGIGFLSFALRIGIPTALFYGAVAASDDKDDWGGALAGLALGFLGVGAAIAIDSAVLARETVTVDPREQTKLRLVPQLAVDPRGGVRAGIGGTF
jgi:hypothetical protein